MRFMRIYTLMIISLAGFGYAGNIASNSSSDDAKGFNLLRDDNVTKIFQDYTIEEDMVVNGNLKIIGGNLNVKGMVNGEIHVLGGNIYIRDMAVINGTIIAIGGKIEKSPAAVINGEILELNQDKFSFSRMDEEDDEISSEDEDDSESCDIVRFQPHSEPYSEDAWVRYNRTDGFYLQLNMYITNEFVPGNILYGGVGRSFTRNKYSGIIGIEQRMFNDHVQAYIEKYDRSQTDDTWRMDDKLNSLAAFLIHEDFLDWYHSEGYEAGAMINLKNIIRLSGTYRDEYHSQMSTEANWSLFGGGKEFRGAYMITEGQEISLTTRLTAGHEYRWMCDQSLTAYFDISRTTTEPDSDFQFTREELTADVFFPFTGELGVHFRIQTGSLRGDAIGLQHIFRVGGIGSLRGYDWKTFEGNHFTTGTIEIVFDEISVFYDQAAVWDEPGMLLSGDNWDQLIQNPVGRAAGVSIGSDDARIDIIKPLSEDSSNEIRVNLIINF